MSEKNKKMSLKVVLPSGVFKEVECTSVNVFALDDENGRNGGSMGIRRGHISTVVALAEGEIKATDGNDVVLSYMAKGGFLVCDNDKITVITE